MYSHSQPALDFVPYYSAQVLDFLGRKNKRKTMAEDLLSRYYACINLRFQEKLTELTKIIDQSAPNKDLQAIFPQLINNIFGTSFGNGWNLKTVTYDHNRLNQLEYEALTSFLDPQGPMFRLCYKLLSDPQLKYDLPLNALPLDLQQSLERGRCPQYYTDMVIVDSQSLNVVALALNPFDYYIFNYALHLVNNSQQQTTWENWNSAYFALACDYLMHFLPSDPNVPVLPHIPQYVGKAAMASPLQTANRPLHTPSLLLRQDLCGMSSQHTTQTQSRTEVWRSETVLQVCIDIWMCVEQYNPREVNLNHRSYSVTSSPERVRIVRVLVKHIHSFAAKHLSNPSMRLSSLPKYARQVMCVRAYHYVRHLATTWPLDASFRLVLELWLSLIQPWRYTDNTTSQDRNQRCSNSQEESNNNALDASFTQFIAENFPSYTHILQLMLPRFMRMDLTAYKNAVMLFRLGKVFSQQHLVQILWNLEQALTDININFNTSESNYNNSYDPSYTYNGVSLSKYVSIAKQAISELNLAPSVEYEPLWSEGNNAFAVEFVKKILTAKVTAEQLADEHTRRWNEENQGAWAQVKLWLMMGQTIQASALAEEYKKVPLLLNSCIHFYSNIFGLQENSLSLDPVADSMLENSSMSSVSFAQSITNKLRKPPTTVQYMGDPDLMPITSYESTILVRIFYQIACKLNELYEDKFISLWNSNGFSGYLAREVLQKPCTIRTYNKEISHQCMVTEDLPPRLSIRRFGSYRFIFWLSIGYIMFRLFSFSGPFYLFFLVAVWTIYTLTKASLKMFRGSMVID